jgi:ABC-2 type transport system ATP-binding protein
LYTPVVIPVPVVIEGLTKRFGRLVAVKDLTLSVPAGQVFGFLGLNGAGKTTTIRILLDLLRPTRGHASILGHDCQADGLAARAAVGYLPGDMRLYPEMTGRRVLQLFARLSGISPDGQRQQDLLERMSFSHTDLIRHIHEYSTGMKRKLGIVQAFQSDPAVLILDEPTEGLDPLMQEAFYDLVEDTRRRGRTVFMSSHVLSEVERVCDRIGILRSGELVLDAPVHDLRRLAPRTVRITFTEDVTPPAAWPAGLSVVDMKPRRWELRSTTDLGPLVTTIATLPVADMDIAERRLEDVVIDYYRGDA